MASESRIVQTASGWFVETPSGNVGPMESEKEAAAYLSLIYRVHAAGRETACTDAECFG